MDFDITITNLSGHKSNSKTGKFLLDLMVQNAYICMYICTIGMIGVTEIFAGL